MEKQSESELLHEFIQNILPKMHDDIIHKAFSNVNAYGVNIRQLCHCKTVALFNLNFFLYASINLS